MILQVAASFNNTFNSLTTFLMLKLLIKKWFFDKSVCRLSVMKVIITFNQKRPLRTQIKNNETAQNTRKMQQTKSRLIVVLYLIVWESGASFFGPITEENKAKPKQSWILSTLNWKLLWNVWKHSGLITRESKAKPKQAWILSTLSCCEMSTLSLPFFFH